MKIVEKVDVISRGNITSSRAWQSAAKNIEQAIRVTDWPHGSGHFKLNPGKTKHENGVLPIKVPCIQQLEVTGWQIERLPKEFAGVPMGNLDAMKETPFGCLGFEWETGNISSSHRAINKIFHAMLRGGLIGGFLVVPSEGMRKYLTDRVGNITELREYFPVWQAIAFDRGAFRIYVVEHDELCEKSPLIPKGIDGRSRQRKRIRSQQSRRRKSDYDST